MSEKTVFISYSHDSDTHQERVRGLSASLCRDGFNVQLDAYKDTDEDWPTWMTRQLLEADFVLCMATETYSRRFRDQELPNVGLGVGWEATLIRRLLYAKKLRNDRIFAAIFDDADRAHIPIELDGYEFFQLDSPTGYETLLRKLLNQPLHTKPGIGAAPKLGTSTTPPLFARPGETSPPAGSTIPADLSRIDRYAPAELIGREAELQVLDDAWAKVQSAESQRPRVLCFVALGGEGKTSLMAHWAAALAHRGWPGCDAAFAWSFYSQGTREQVAVSSDLFLAEALRFFGDSALADSPTPAYDKGKRLAQLAGARRAVLILDGLEPLQYPPTSPTPGELKDQGLTALLKGLALTNAGLCIVTTRYAVADLKVYANKGAPSIPLKRLSPTAGVELLKKLGVKGSQAEYEKLVEDVRGHALTLNLLGSYLRDAHGGDIRQRDRIKLAEADDEEQGGHAFRVMDAYARWLANSPLSRNAGEGWGEGKAEGTRGPIMLAILRLLGLFDRPASADCLQALWQPPVIAGLTEPLVGLSNAQRNLALKRLEDAQLISVNRAPSGTLLAIDAHPLLREYFARQLRGTGFQPVIQSHGQDAHATSGSGTGFQPVNQTHGQDAHATAHRRLFEHLCATTQEGQQPTLEDLQPLYQAVAHGCQAGLRQEACEQVYRDRILRGTGNDGFYSTKKLGAFGSDLGAVACFFEQTWSRVSPALTETDQAWLLNEAAFSLRALGRLTEALEPMRAGIEGAVKVEDWKNAAIRASNLSELELTLGGVNQAVTDAEQSVSYADRSGDAFLRMAFRATLADALHQAGRRDEAAARFREAEQIQAKDEPDYPLLYSLGGFRYCELLLAEAERAAWRVMCGTGFQPVTQNHGQDGHATTRGTGFQPVIQNHGQDSHATNAHGTEFQPVISDLQHGQDARATQAQATARFRQGAYLPHLTQEGGIYAVTFRLADSLPAHILEQWQRERESLIKKAQLEGRELSADDRRRLRDLYSEQVETYLDLGKGECWLRRDDIAGIVQGALQHFAGQRYDLLAWVVMPNHVHVVLQPLAGFELENIVHSWKSYTAQQANAALQRSGAFWQTEYYDHLIRDEADLEHAVNYVLANPAMAGLQHWPWVGSGTGFQPVTNVADHGLEARATLDEVVERAAKMFEWRVPSDPLLDIALDHLTLGRAALYAAILQPAASPDLQDHLAAAMSGLRRAGTTHHIPRGLLTRAWLRCLPSTSSGQAPSPSSETTLAGARDDLDEAWDIAERGPMPLFMADIHLHRARLFFRVAPYPWVSPQHDLAEARRLITQHGYWRRKEELEDAEAVIGT